MCKGLDRVKVNFLYLATLRAGKAQEHIVHLELAQNPVECCPFGAGKAKPRRVLSTWSLGKSTWS